MTVQPDQRFLDEAVRGKDRAQAGNQAPSVPWKDLVPLSTREKLMELTIPLPWFLASLWCYHAGWWVAGLIGSFYFFLTGLRQSHGAQHYSLGIQRPMQDLILFLLSVFMGASMHAVQVSHLHHHRHCLEEDDSEGVTARMKWWEAIAMGPLFPIRLHVAAWRLGSRAKRRWIIAELCGMAALFLAAVLWPGAITWHVAAMVAGECLTGFFAVWTVHHGCEAPGAIARTQRGRWLNFISYNMFFHVEHHLYPAVPTCHLGMLAARLDAANPSFARRQVVGN